MRITVLGCGPAGLMAAHGAVNAHTDMRMAHELELTILSRKRKSELYGAQYLHRPIPNISDRGERVHISYTLRGTPQQYRDKVYGKIWHGSVSPEDLDHSHLGWDIRTAYGRLWSTYQNHIIDVDIRPSLLERLDGTVINSIPLDAMCAQGHDFGFTTITAAGDAPERGIMVSDTFSCDDNAVVCNGAESPSWYRMSRVFGHTTVEWPTSVGRVPIESAAQVRKPTRTDCNCWPHMFRVGRYGTWKKGVLSHEAYYDTYTNVIRGLKEEQVASSEAGS